MADYDLQYQDTHIDALLATANELKTAGYIYKGVATPSTNPGTPTERVAYLASEPGTYANFGGIVITSGLYSLTYASGTWTGTQMSAGSDIEVVQTTGQSASDVMSQKAVTDEIENIYPHIYKDESVDIGGLTKMTGGIQSDGGWTAVNASVIKARSLFIPVTPNERYILTQGASSGNQYYTIIDTMFNTDTNQSASNINYATGYSTRVLLAAGNSVVIDVPNDGHYLIVRADEPGGTFFAPTLIQKVAINSRVDKINDEIVAKHQVTEAYFDHALLSITNNVATYTASANWSSKIIPVKDLVAVDIVATNLAGVPLGPPVVFLRGPEPTQENWIQGAEMYGSIATNISYISRLTTSIFNIPAEATHVLLQNVNTISTDSWVWVYDIDTIRKDIDKIKSQIVIVDAKGNGDYTTIVSAIDATSDGDTIIVNSGTYDEIIHAWDKDRHIVGVCRETCILTNGTGRYATPPLEMNIGSIENMTIIADNYDSTIVDPTTQQERTSYAIHVEHAYSTPFRLVIRNCTIISKWNAAIGAGVRYNQELIIEDCDLKTECVQAWSDGQSAFKSLGAIFFHNDVGASNTQTGHFVLKNCRLRGVNYALSYVPLANRPYLEVEFINNNLCTTNNGVTNIVDNWQPSVTGMIYKSVCCYGNNIAELNA